MQPDANTVTFTFASPAQDLSINVTFELRPGTAFVSKTITLTDTRGAGSEPTREVNSVTAMDGVAVRLDGAAPAATRTSNNVQFLRTANPQAPGAPSHTGGVFLTAQNSFVQPPALAWQLDQNWTTAQEPRTLDSAIIGLYGGATSQLELAEAAADTHSWTDSETALRPAMTPREANCRRVETGRFGGGRRRHWLPNRRQHGAG